MREIHWHPNADEWQYFIAGKARMTVFAAEGRARTFDFQAGDVGYVPLSMGHFIENIGSEPLSFLELFRSPWYMDVSLTQWMALTPPELVEAHLKIDRAHCLTQNVTGQLLADDWVGAIELVRWRLWRERSAWARGARWCRR
jgi:oxalate decarboxylase family bicupin protein